jgi:putative membrane protein
MRRFISIVGEVSMHVTEASETVTNDARSRRNLKDYAGLTLRGMAMGAADIVPGVSGGTMAFILGIYEELLHSIRAIGRPEFLRAAFRLRLKEALQILNWPFLTAVALGIFISILTLSGLLEWLLVNQPIYIWSFFFGLVLASAFTVSQRVSNWKPVTYLVLALGAVGAYLVVGLVPAQTPDAWWFLLLSGALASCAMILPGISGAFILFILGKYQFVLSAVNNRDIVSIGLVGIGAVIGLVSFAQVLSWLFKRYHDLTVAVLIGLMLGSLRKLWPWKLDVEWLLDSAGNFVLDRHGDLMVIRQANVLPDFSTQAGLMETAVAFTLALIGIAAVVLLDRLAGQKEQAAEAA